MKPSKWPFKIRSPIGLGGRCGREEFSPGTPIVDARRFFLFEGDVGTAGGGEVARCASTGAAGARAVGGCGGETWGCKRRKKIESAPELNCVKNAEMGKWEGWKDVRGQEPSPS